MHPRILVPLLAAVALAACSGNIGGGQSTLPGTPQGTTNTQQVSAPTPTASPVSASNVATVGDAAVSQALPAVMGYGGTITFPKPVAAPSPSPNAKSTPAASAASPGGPVSIGITAAVVEPSDAPHLDVKGRRATGKHADPAALKGLLYITLLATEDVTLGEYPKIAVDVPREVAARYRERALALALYDPEKREKTYRLGVAERDLTSPAPASTTVAATPQPIPTGPPSGSANGASAFTPPPIGTGLDAGTLPPEHVAFAATAATLTLKANRPVVFALYAAAQPSPSPAPTGSAAAVAPTVTPTAPATASPAPSPVPS